MKIEGDYIIFGVNECGTLRDRKPGDQWKYHDVEDNNAWHNCDVEPPFDRIGYANGIYLIRRLIEHCTAEHLTACGHSELNQHFI